MLSSSSSCFLTALCVCFSGKRILKVTIIPKVDGAVRVITMQLTIPASTITEVRSEAVTGLAQQTCSDLGGTFRSGHGLSSADAFRPWCSQVPGGGVVDFLRKLFLFISHTILSKAKVAESNLHLENNYITTVH